MNYTEICVTVAAILQVVLGILQAWKIRIELGNKELALKLQLKLNNVETINLVQCGSLARVEKQNAEQSATLQKVEKQTNGLMDEREKRLAAAVENVSDKVVDKLAEKGLTP